MKASFFLQQRLDVIVILVKPVLVIAACGYQYHVACSITGVRKSSPVRFNIPNARAMFLKSVRDFSSKRLLDFVTAVLRDVLTI